MVGKISSKGGIWSLKAALPMFALISLFFLAAPRAGAAVGECTDANLSFDKSSYKAGEKVTLKGSNPSGTWTLCIYRGNERIAVTVDSIDSELSVNLPKDYMGQELTGVIHLNGICSNDLDGERNCRVRANDNGVDEEAASAANNGGQGNAGTGTGANQGNTNGAGAGVETKAANSTPTSSGTGSSEAEKVKTEVKNPLKTASFTKLVTNFELWLLGIASSVALLMLIYGGVIYISSAGDPQKAQTGKRIVMWTIFGLLIVLLSWSIIDVVEKVFVN